MKKSFVYALSAVFALSVMMAQIPAQAATTHHHVKKVHHEKRMMHHKKGMTGGAAGITKKHTTGTKMKKEKPMKKQYKKY